MELVIRALFVLGGIVTMCFALIVLIFFSEQMRRIKEELMKAEKGFVEEEKISV